jgi:rubrerythrin
MALFDPREMLKMAVMDEETGVAFYKALAARTDRPDLESALISISKQEEIHAKRFKEMLDALGGYKPSGEAYAGQHEEFLKALVESRAFPNPDAAVKKAETVTDDAEGIDISIRLEKDALAFYATLQGALSPTDAGAVEAVIEEERGHLAELARLRRTLR